VNKRHCRVGGEHEITNVTQQTIESYMYLRNASMTINTSRSNTFSGGPTGSSPKSRKSCGPFAVAKPANTFLYGKNPRANNAIPTSCSIEEMNIRRHNPRVFIRGPFLCRPRGLVPKRVVGDGPPAAMHEGYLGPRKRVRKSPIKTPTSVVPSPLTVTSPLRPTKSPCDNASCSQRRCLEEHRR